MDNVTGFGPGVGCSRPPGCDDEYISSNTTCIYIESVEGCNIHRVGLGLDSTQIKTECYMVSNVSEYYNTYCGPPHQQLNGPPFLDRLDGRKHLSQKYMLQTKEKYNTTLIGIETLVDVYDLMNYSTLEVNETSSWVDYLFWQEVEGCKVLSACMGEGYAFNLDCPHGFKYHVSTECNQKGCCGDGTCNLGENYVKCPVDCPIPAACPSLLGLNGCITPSGSLYNVTYTLHVMNSTAAMNLSTTPTIRIQNDTAVDSHTMNQIMSQTGAYNITVGPLGQNDNINATVYVSTS